MKKTGLAAAGIIILSLVAILVIVVSLLNAAPPALPAPAINHTQTKAITLTPTLTATPDPCSVENFQGTLMAFDQVSREFSDAFVLAQNTPAARLSTVIPDMQKIRRRAEDFAVPPCLTTLKEHQLGFMNTAIDVSLLLYSSFSGDPNQTLTQEQVNGVVAQVNQLMTQASDYARQYQTEMARLLGVTLTPSPSTPEPDDASTPVETSPAL
ncbi:MAG: hypothetical protein EHM40_02255 [Chloroflexi bacterium]|nr:MAG: hypothetical protein EHM40_12500 [Chloroflexota bacterium]RPI95906.1 MAG: hypothetical protein EHM40_02255 [Chloroflexota bacterium]